MRDRFTKQWIIDNAIEIVHRYDKGILTLRSLHYQLVGEGMTNDIQHYKRVVNAMIQARWDDQISFDTFSDLDREMVGATEYEVTNVDKAIEEGKRQVQAWMKYYNKNRWENQPYYPEVFIEKKALQGVFQNSCRKWDVALGACKGYPSLTFLHETHQRFLEATENGKHPIIIYFGDYDPSGEDIPRSIHDNLSKFGVEVEIRRIALMEHQVLEWKLPPAPAKLTDTRTAKWDGLGQVELDAVRPERLMKLLDDALNEIFDNDLYRELMKQEDEEKTIYIDQLKQYVTEL